MNPNRLIQRGAVAMAAAAALGCAARPPAVTPAGEVATIRSVEVRSPFGMVSAASREPAEVAAAILERGGTAVDAAVAAAFALGAADPAASGLGGATQALIRFADGRVTSIDGTSTMPRFVDRERLVTSHAALAATDEDDTYGHEFVAVPGTAAALGYMAERFATLSWAELLAPAIRMAEEGTDLTSADIAAIEKYQPSIRRSEFLRFWVLDEGEFIPAAGTRSCNPELARTLRLLADRGADEFYRGSIATVIEADMIRNGGFVRRADLALYRAAERPAWRGTYRGLEILSFPPPAAGGAVIEALNILGNFSPEVLRTPGTTRLQTLAGAFHVAFEDNGRFCRDPEDARLRMGPPHLTKEFAAARAALVRKGRALTKEDLPPAPGEPWHVGGTTPLAIADRFGNVVSLSQTIGRFYGAKVLTASLGFPYNSLMESVDLSDPAACRPGGRVSVLMAPTIVLRDGRPYVALGASGSAKVPSTVVQTISDLVDSGLTLREAVDRPRIMWNVRGHDSGIYLEVRDEITPVDVQALRELGFAHVTETVYPAALRALSRLGIVSAVTYDAETHTFCGVGDPRRRGVAVAPRM